MTPFSQKERSKPGTRLGVLAHPFGNNIASAGKGFLRGRDPLFRIDEALGFRNRVGGGLLSEKPVSQGLQPLVPGHRRPGAALRPEWKIEIFQYRQCFRLPHPGVQLIGQLPLLFKGL